MSIIPSKTGINYFNGIVLKNLKSMEQSIRYDSYLKKKETKRKEELLEGLTTVHISRSELYVSKTHPSHPIIWLLTLNFFCCSQVLIVSMFFQCKNVGTRNAMFLFYYHWYHANSPMYVVPIFHRLTFLVHLPY